MKKIQKEVIGRAGEKEKMNKKKFTRASLLVYLTSLDDLG